MAIDHIDLSNEISDWQEAIYGRDVRSANVAAFEKIQASVNEAIDEVSDAAEQSNDTAAASRAILAQATSALANANAALQNVEDVRQDLADRVEAGEFDGEQGPKGPQGPQGASGVMAPSAGMFSLYLDPATGNLYAEYPDGSTPPQFEYDAETGNLYYVTDEGGE